MSLNMVAGGSSRISHDAYIVDMHPQALNKQRQAPRERPKNDQIQVGEGFSCTTYNGYIMRYIYICVYTYSKSFPAAFCRALLSHEMVVFMPTTEWMSIPDNLFFSGSILETTKKNVLISTTTIVKILLLFPNLLVVTTGQTMLACVSNTSVRTWINLGLSYHTWVEYIHLY